VDVVPDGSGESRTAGDVPPRASVPCPWRHDLGLRYLREDLPPDVADQVEELVPGASSATLEELSLQCFAWLDELLVDRPADLP